VPKKILNPDPVYFPPELWKHITEIAQDFCHKLLEKKAEHRLSAAQALDHAWLLDPAKPSPVGNVNALTHSTFEDLKTYQGYNKMKRAVLQLLTHELSGRQISELRDKFMALDAQGNGFLSREDLLRGLRHIGEAMSNQQLDEIIAALDGTDRSADTKQIGYNQFVSALVGRRLKFNRRQLWECFKKFDMDNTGVITFENVQRAMNGVTESEWQEIATIDGKGYPQLSFDEFVALMEAP